jgi:hypothetical protein
MQFVGRCGTWRFTSCVEKRVLQALQFLNMGDGCSFPEGEGINHKPE